MTRGRLKGLLYLVTRWFCSPFAVNGGARVPEQPVVFVANHTSHADTAALLAGLPRKMRKALAPAAAEDYWFTGRVRRALVTAVTGAFPFPRHGREGIERAWTLLQQGNSVLLYPEGTRSRGKGVGEFRCGVGLLAKRGATIVPVGIGGAGEVFPKGTKLPRRAPVAITFGEPRRFARDVPAETIAKELRDDVCDLAAYANQTLGASRPTLYERASRFAGSRASLWFAFGWAVAEALWWPLIPDFLIAPLALAAPSRALLLAGAATLGSVTGGAIAFHLGDVGQWLATHAPLVTPRMHGHALASMTESGAMGLLGQPLSGIPYKAFALQAAPAGVPLPGFALMTVLARGLRIVAVAAIFAGGGVALRRVWPRIFGAFLITYFVVFAFGLDATIDSWR